MLYLKRVILKNNGPFEKFILDLPFSSNGNPKPLGLIGKNGSGKSILLSCIADGIMEFANSVFKDILDGTPNHSYFRTIGFTSRTSLTNHGWALLDFFNEKNEIYQFFEKNGIISYEDLIKETGENLTIDKTHFEKIPKDESFKYFSKNREFFPNEFIQNSYCFFPSNRFEHPHWLNPIFTEAKAGPTIEIRDSQELNKPILITSSFQNNYEWLLSVLMDFKWRSSGSQWTITVEKKLTQIIRIILDDPSVDFCLNPRHSASQISLGKHIEGTEQFTQILPTLRNLSAGQSTLLNLFLTIIRYSDYTERTSFEDIQGIVLIDEIDLFLHVYLQNKALPLLIKFFPKVQFIFSTHSPLVLTGMKELFGDEFQIIELPTGATCDVSSFEEFDHACTIYLKENERFKKNLNYLETKLKKINKPILITEGKTDWMHLKTALKKLTAKGYFQSLSIDFMEYDSNVEMGDNELMKYCEYLSKLPQEKKVICVFDRDNDSIIKKHQENGGIKKWGNNVFSFCIPSPPHRKDYKNISIEMLYSDDELKTPEPESKKRLYFTNEVKLSYEIDLITKKKKNSEWRALDIPETESELEKKIITEDCGKYENSLGEKVAISKTVFAQLIFEGAGLFNNFDFEPFRAIFDTAQEILDIE